MASIGRALMGGLAHGFGAFANMKYDEKQKAEQAERDQELAKLTQQLKEEAARFDASLNPAQYQTIEDTGPDGKTIKRTIKSRYDRDQGPIEEEVGSVTIDPKDDRVAVEREMALYDADPDKYRKFKLAGQRPLVSSGGSDSETFGFDEYETMAPERRALFDRWKGRASAKDQGAADRRWLAEETQKAVSDYDSTASDFTARQNLLGAFGISPDDPKARQKYRDAYKADLESQFPTGDEPETPKGKPLMESIGGSERPYPKFDREPFSPKQDIFSEAGPSQGADAAPKPKDAAAKDEKANVPPEIQTLMAQAEKAIKSGADPAQVKARLNDMLKAKGYSLK